MRARLPDLRRPVGNTGPLAKTVALRILELIDARRDARRRSRHEHARRSAARCHSVRRGRQRRRPLTTRRATGARVEDPRPEPRDGRSLADVARRRVARARRPALPRRRSHVRARPSSRRDGRVADGLPPSDGVWPRLSLLARRRSRARAAGLLFVDLETTGLAGGAGTYAFLVGCGWFDGGTFRIRQFFLSSFAAERALLEAVAERRRHGGHGRHLQRQVVRPAADRDALPAAPAGDAVRRAAARRHAASGAAPVACGDDGTRRRAGSCRLSTLEETLCGYVREGDVPGFEIPGALLPLRAQPATRGRWRRCSSTTGSTCCRWRSSPRAPRSCSTKARPARARRAKRSAWAGLYERGG